MTLLRCRHRPIPLLLVLLVLSGAVRSQALERWFYVSQNLWVDQNVTNVLALMQRAAQAGYTHMLVSDSKFSRLATMDARYFNNLNLIKQAATNLNLEVVPELFPVGYSNDLLFNDPNLIEGMPVTNALLVVSNDVALIQPDPPVAFPGGDFSNLALWSWKDSTVVQDNGTARVTDPNGANARIVQQLTVQPFRQYHISVQVKATNFVVAPQVLVLGGGLALNYNGLRVQPTQGWTTHHAVFNSLTNTTVNVYFGVWGGTTGSLWWDNAVIEEVAFLNLIRRPGAPLTVQTESGTPLVEGSDFATLTDPLMGSVPWAGSYDIYHTPPQLQILSPGLTNGTRLRVSWTHAVTVYDDQANICVSEPATVNLLRDQAQRMQAAWGTRGYFMSHDEIRVFNWCAACQARGLDAGALLADNVRTCASILRQVNPGGRIYVWTDMFDPNHNAHGNYYLARGNFTNSWQGLDSDIIVVPWYYDQRAASLQFFAGLGNRQLIAGYYDAAPTLVTNWLNAARPYPGICGVMYTTGQNDYSNLETFEQLLAGYPAPSLWLTPRLLGSFSGGQPQIVVEGERGRSYIVQQSPDFSNWSTWTNVTANDATLTFTPDAISDKARFYRAACVQ
ncbi:MAG TPA: hypothetical protein VN578_03650 [Candidatus Binatia bacterium]|jgi:hypothetical protein|nr:hypothetical protein [Candidatus Binatia bacterium]